MCQLPRVSHPGTIMWGLTFTASSFSFWKNQVLKVLEFKTCIPEAQPPQREAFSPRQVPHTALWTLRSLATSCFPGLTSLLRDMEQSNLKSSTGFQAWGDLGTRTASCWRWHQPTTAESSGSGDTHSGICSNGKVLVSLKGFTFPP